MTREKIQAGLMEAIEVAKLAGEPASMIRGWSEIAKLTGLNAPEKKEVTLLPGQTAAKRQLEELTETQLMELLGEDIDIVDADFEEVFDARKMVAQLPTTSGPPDPNTDADADPAEMEANDLPNAGNDAPSDGGVRGTED